MDNEYFDISIFNTVDSVSLAIDASAELPCTSKTLQLMVKDMDPGTYTLSLGTRGDFGNYKYTLIDRYLHKNTVLDNGYDTEFTVSTDSASRSWDRFRIELEEIVPDTGAEVYASEVACSERQFNISMPKATRGFYYSVYTRQGNQITEEVRGEGGLLRLEIPGSLLPAGRDTLVIVARSVCRQVELLTRIPISKEPDFQLQLSTISGCYGSQVTLTANSGDGQTYLWFESETSEDTLSLSDHLITPRITKSETFYVAAISQAGCRSKRIPVEVELANYEPAVISRIGPFTLSSSYDNNNRWFHNGQELIGESGQQLALNSSGTYVLLVENPGCIRSDTLVIELNNGNSTTPFLLFPNPVRSTLFIKSDDADIAGIEIRDVQGRSLRRIEEFEGLRRTRFATLDTAVWKQGLT